MTRYTLLQSTRDDVPTLLRARSPPNVVIAAAVAFLLLLFLRPREGLVTFGALEWSDSGMLPEVVTQIAALLEDAVTSFVLTFEE